MHSGGGINFYAGILCDRPYRICGIYSDLRNKDRVYVSFGTNHVYFWSTAVYGGVPSIHKGLDEIDKNPYHSLGKTLREELADIPKGTI